nr:PhnD/SsuA/transferrin family substrate-binding protein [Patulibacter sp. SYSU D01012]
MADDDAAGARAAEVFRADLAEQLGCRVVVVPYATQARVVTALAVHEVDLGQLDPAALVVADRAAGVASVGAYAVDQDTPARAGALALWTRRDGPRDLAGLRGRRLALGAPLTAGGDLAPRAALLAAGVRADAPATDDVLDAGDDAEALRALRAGRVDAALTRQRPARREVRGLRRVWRATGPLADVVAIRPGIPNAFRRLVLVAVRQLPGRTLAPLAARQGIQQPAPLTSVPLDLYGPVAAQLDDLVGAGLRP